MIISRAYRVALDPTQEQAAAFGRHCGAARWVYNWGLSRKADAFREKTKLPSCQTLDGALRREMDEAAPWLREINGYARQAALADLDKAFANFFRKCKTGTRLEGVRNRPGRVYTEAQREKLQHLAAFPKFQRRREGRGSYRTYGFAVESGRIRIANIGWVKLQPGEKDYVPVGGYGKNTETVKFISVTISEEAGRWFASVQVETQIPDPQSGRELAVGVHWGIGDVVAYFVAEDGSRVEFKNAKALAKHLKRLARLQRHASRKQEARKVKPILNEEGREVVSNNRKRLYHKIGRVHSGVVHQRTHTTHHISHVVTRKPSVLAVETWRVKDMQMDREGMGPFVARAFADAGISEMRRRVGYKSAWRGVSLIQAEAGYPSTRTCSRCGAVNDAVGGRKTWECPACGARHDREWNAAQNLLNMAVKYRVQPSGESSRTLIAPGGAGSGSEAAMPPGETIPGERRSGKGNRTAPRENAGIPEKGDGGK